MDSHNERYFFLSGLISFSLFALLVLLIGYTLLSSQKIEQFAMFQSEFVSVSVEISDTPAPSQSVARSPEPVSEPVEEKAAPAEEKTVETVPEISDLFSQVKPQTEPQKKNDRTKRNEELSALEKEIMAPSEKQRISDKVKNVELLKPGMKMTVQGGSSGPIVNEYHAKIQGLIYTHFHPPAGSEGQAARVRIKISADGRLVSYRVIAYSGSAALNGEVDWLKERLGSIQFPSHPERKEALLECILTAKE
ncbi:MAG: TonB C-terminal domain-containing protein [Campylobacterales bacterium]|nr:TonB C-terminal domain-containing protein [Campylobacterales bacterium]